MKPYVKVSGIIGPTDHTQLKAIAKERKTTVGELVAAAVRLLLANPAAATRLPLDRRIKA